MTLVIAFHSLLLGFWYRFSYARLWILVCLPFLFHWLLVCLVSLAIWPEHWLDLGLCGNPYLLFANAIKLWCSTRKGVQVLLEELSPHVFAKAIADFS